MRNHPNAVRRRYMFLPPTNASATSTPLLPISVDSGSPRSPTGRGLDTVSNEVFLSAPCATFNTARYQRAVACIAARHPAQACRFPHALWGDNAQWLKTYRRLLRRVTHLYILPNEDGTVGKGVWTEVSYLVRRRSFNPHLALGFSADFTLTSQWHLMLLNDGDDWRRYAVLHVDAPIPEAAAP